MRSTALVTTFFAVMLVTGCGWHLRGTSDIPALGSLFIKVGGVNGELVENLRENLRSGGIKLVGDPAKANYQLVLVEQRSRQRTATVNVGARVAELMLSEDIDFLVLDNAGAQVLAPSTASVERTFEYTESNALASEDESRLISSEMQADLARQIVNRLQQVRKTTAPAATSTDATLPAPAASTTRDATAP